MDQGVIATTFIVVFREALEASLIVGIILTVLYRMEQTRYFKHVIWSVVAALVASALAGWGLMSLTASAQGQWGKFIEGGISLIACVILTYMVFWMDRQARNIRPEIEHQLEHAITSQELMAIVGLPFLAIFREGAETVLFLAGIAAKSGAVSFWGAIAGTVLAVGIVSLIFIGGKRIPLKPLFKGSGLLVLMIAAGLLAYGIHEFQEIGVIPEIVYPVWNINHILNEKEGVGSFLKALFGYNGNPSLIEIVSYVAYLSSVIFLLNKRAAPPKSA